MQSTNKSPGPLRSSNWMVLTLGLGLIGGVALDRLATNGWAGPGSTVNFHLIAEAGRIVRWYYVDWAAVKPRVLTYGAISGMVDALGDTGHSRFLSPAMVLAMQTLERNKFQGIGAQIQSKAGHVVIVTPMDGSPALRAGLHPGDIIMRVNGQEITGLPLDQVVEKISGPAGTSVTLLILDPASGRTREVTLERAALTIHNVTWHMLPGTKVAHLRIAAVDKDAARDLRQALAEIKGDGARGIILDLRNNPGGLLEEAVGVASQFLDKGNVLLVKNAHGQKRPVPVRPGGEATETPLVALINGGTASGAEILAAALQDAPRARLVGETTVGTGTVLNEFKLSDGSALLLAVDEWLTPDGHVIWHKGVTPNIEVELPAGASPVFPRSERTMTAEELHASHDTQLLRALQLLQQPPVKPEGGSL